ncbi:RNA 2',3'-cyclic phosphodiesterase [Stieleria sp. TO1_6]|uniref:RNA 2',3'-cyclic phosphodiesterase n=1 Tax=Stieleria tagensis TaxID=2956795 RepID=UPI00209B92D2|nr:RNA 2',3'-cyclic phosphodiesterase [Stieleria tagensis]MCO8124222.1 RNA 2',3'-cyclic phosphodiesterase [Stieleria tagensis]
MQTIRSFISIPVPAAVTSAAGKIIKRLKPLDSGVKWVPLDNFHLTLKFLGEVDNVEVPAVCKAIRKITDSLEPFELSFAGTGGFPTSDRPRILYAGVADPTGSLVRLAMGLEKQLAELGFKPEPRDYTPHLTLGRTRSNSRRADSQIVAALEEMKDIELGQMIVDEVCLMASFLDKSGPTYQVMDTIELEERPSSNDSAEL